jgi:hypothetical protein
MELVAGWLFLNLERTRLIFIADGLEVEEHFDWNNLLEHGCFDEFVKHFDASPTKEGPLQGFRIDAPSAEIAKWFQKNCVKSRKSTANY